MDWTGTTSCQNCVILNKKLELFHLLKQQCTKNDDVAKNLLLMKKACEKYSKVLENKTQKLLEVRKILKAKEKTEEILKRKFSDYQLRLVTADTKHQELLNELEVEKLNSTALLKENQCLKDLVEQKENEVRCHIVTKRQTDELLKDEAEKQKSTFQNLEGVIQKLKKKHESQLKVKNGIQRKYSKLRESLLKSMDDESVLVEEQFSKLKKLVSRLKSQDRAAKLEAELNTPTPTPDGATSSDTGIFSGEEDAASGFLDDDLQISSDSSDDDFENVPIPVCRKADVGVCFSPVKSFASNQQHAAGSNQKRIAEQLSKFNSNESFEDVDNTLTPSIQDDIEADLEQPEVLSSVSPMGASNFNSEQTSVLPSQNLMQPSNRSDSIFDIPTCDLSSLQSHEEAGSDWGAIKGREKIVLSPVKGPDSNSVSSPVKVSEASSVFSPVKDLDTNSVLSPIKVFSPVKGSKTISYFNSVSSPSNKHQAETCASLSVMETSTTCKKKESLMKNLIRKSPEKSISVEEVSPKTDCDSPCISSALKMQLGLPSLLQETSAMMDNLSDNSESDEDLPDIPFQFEVKCPMTSSKSSLANDALKAGEINFSAQTRIQSDISNVTIKSPLKSHPSPEVASLPDISSDNDEPENIGRPVKHLLSKLPLDQSFARTSPTADESFTAMGDISDVGNSLVIHASSSEQCQESSLTNLDMASTIEKCGSTQMLNEDSDSEDFDAILIAMQPPPTPIMPFSEDSSSFDDINSDIPSTYDSTLTWTEDQPTRKTQASFILNTSIGTNTENNKEYANVATSPVRCLFKDVCVSPIKPKRRHQGTNLTGMEKETPFLSSMKRTADVGVQIVDEVDLSASLNSKKLVDQGTNLTGMEKESPFLSYLKKCADIGVQSAYEPDLKSKSSVDQGTNLTGLEKETPFLLSLMKPVGALNVCVQDTSAMPKHRPPLDVEEIPVPDSKEMIQKAVKILGINSVCLAGVVVDKAMIEEVRQAIEMTLNKKSRNVTFFRRGVSPVQQQSFCTFSPCEFAELCNQQHYNLHLLAKSKNLEKTMCSFGKTNKLKRKRLSRYSTRKKREELSLSFKEEIVDNDNSDGMKVSAVSNESECGLVNPRQNCDTSTINSTKPSEGECTGILSGNPTPDICDISSLYSQGPLSKAPQTVRECVFNTSSQRKCGTSQISASTDSTITCSAKSKCCVSATVNSESHQTSNEDVLTSIEKTRCRENIEDQRDSLSSSCRSSDADQHCSKLNSSTGHVDRVECESDSDSDRLEIVVQNGVESTETSTTTVTAVEFISNINDSFSVENNSSETDCAAAQILPDPVPPTEVTAGRMVLRKRPQSSSESSECMSQEHIDPTPVRRSPRVKKVKLTRDLDSGSKGSYLTDYRKFVKGRTVFGSCEEEQQKIESSSSGADETAFSRSTETKTSDLKSCTAESVDATTDELSSSTLVPSGPCLDNVFIKMSEELPCNINTLKRVYSDNCNDTISLKKLKIASSKNVPEISENVTVEDEIDTSDTSIEDDDVCSRLKRGVSSRKPSKLQKLRSSVSRVHPLAQATKPLKFKPCERVADEETSCVRTSLASPRREEVASKKLQVVSPKDVSEISENITVQDEIVTSYTTIEDDVVTRSRPRRGVSHRKPSKLQKLRSSVTKIHPLAQATIPVKSKPDNEVADEETSCVRTSLPSSHPGEEVKLSSHSFAEEKRLKARADAIEKLKARESIRMAAAASGRTAQLIEVKRSCSSSLVSRKTMPTGGGRQQPLVRPENRISMAKKFCGRLEASSGGVEAEDSLAPQRCPLPNTMKSSPRASTSFSDIEPPNSPILFANTGTPHKSSEITSFLVLNDDRIVTKWNPLEYVVVEQPSQTIHCVKKDLQATEKLVKEVLKGFVAATSFTPEVLQKTINSLSSSDHPYILPVLVRDIVNMMNDDHDTPISGFGQLRSNVPPMTPVQQQLLTLLLQLSFQHESFQQLPHDVLKLFQFRVFRLGRAPADQQLLWCTRMYIAICRALCLRKQALLFCWDALYTMRKKSYDVVKTVFDMWPYLFPINASFEKVCPNTQVMVHLLRSHVDEPSIDGRARRFDKSWLKLFLNSPALKAPSVNSSILLSKFYLNMIGGGKAINIPALVLLAKREEENWTMRDVVSGKLLPALEKWCNRSLGDIAGERIIWTLCSVLRALPPERHGATPHVVMGLLRSELQKLGKEQASYHMQEVLAMGLVLLSRHDIENVAQAFLSWRPDHGASKGYSSQLLHHLSDMVKSGSRNLKWWKSIVKSSDESDKKEV